MEFKKKVTMSISNWRDYVDDENLSLAFAKVDFLSNRPNSHLHKYSEEVIKEYAPSYLGKFMVAEYDKRINDTLGHTENQNIVGYIPSNQEVDYRYDEDGYLIASLDVVISKIYANEVYKLFAKKGVKGVSVEQLVGFTEETKNYIDGLKEKVVIGFEGIGICILGDKIKPSLPNANITMVKMSAEEFEAEYTKHNIKVSDSDKFDEILNKLSNIEQKISKEEMMKDKEIEVVEETMAEEVVVEEVATETEQVETEVVEEVVETETETTMEEETIVDEKVEMEELKEKLMQAEDKIAKYEEEISELKVFKAQVEETKCQEIIENTLSIAKKVVDETKYNELEEESKECVYATVNEWSTKIKASVSEMAIAKMEEVKLSIKDEDVLDMGMSVYTEKKKKTIYD